MAVGEAGRLQYLTDQPDRLLGVEARCRSAAFIGCGPLRTAWRCSRSPRTRRRDRRPRRCWGAGGRPRLPPRAGIVRRTRRGSWEKRPCKTFRATRRCRCVSSLPARRPRHRLRSRSASAPDSARRRRCPRSPQALLCAPLLLVSWLTSFAMQDRFRDAAKDRRRHVVAELRRALDRGGDCDLRVLSRRAKPMNQPCFSAAPPPQDALPGVSAVPVLPATATPGIAALVPVPSRTTPSIAVVSSAAVFALIGLLYSEGLRRLTTRPSGSTTRLQICGFINLPRSATAAATSAICSGVTAKRSCPIATREIDPGAGTEQLSSFNESTRLELAFRKVNRRRRVEAEAVHGQTACSRRSSLTELTESGVDRIGQRGPSEIEPKLWSEPFAAAGPGLPASPARLSSFPA